MKAFPELGDEELDRYLDANVAAVRRGLPTLAAGFDAALAGHLVMGPAILARAEVGDFAAKVHGSALEYTVKPKSALPASCRGGDARRRLRPGRLAAHGRVALGRAAECV